VVRRKKGDSWTDNNTPVGGATVLPDKSWS
jgi:hypothetical protein